MSEEELDPVEQLRRVGIDWYSVGWPLVGCRLVSMRL